MKNIIFLTQNKTPRSGMLIKKLQKIIKRHPLLYLTRFRLLSQNSSIDEIAGLYYNQWNKKKHIPGYFFEINQRIFAEGLPENDMDKVLKISIWLKEHIKGGRGLSEPSEKALKNMLYGKGGVCSDMAQIFNNFCVINDIKVREWGTTTIPFDRLHGGHAFNEVYIKELDKWLLIDVYWGLMFHRSDDDFPLSVIELYTLKRNNGLYHYKSYLHQEVDASILERNYLNTSIAPFLIYNYKNKVYDTFLEYTRPLVPIFVIHFFVYLIGQNYRYKFPLDDYKQLFA